MSSINPREIYLLEIFSSPKYLAELRDAWLEMIAHVEECLKRYMNNLPPNYRRAPLSEQPDKVWGEHVLPNFRSIAERLRASVISLSHGDISAMRAANGPLNALKGQSEFSTEWLRADEADRYFDLLHTAVTMAQNICATEEPYWEPGDLLRDAKEFLVTLPSSFPEYRLSPDTRISTEEPVKQHGIYVPDLPGSCAQFLNPYSEAPPASIFVGTRDLLNPDTGATYGEEPVLESKPCQWILVERNDSIHLPRLQVYL